ncbi:MAG: hypothetical protein N4A57_02450 [Anaeromicrobium sp.]|jgi:uncharacterized FAD-dependent dehydrogenase|uniref:NAD(P)/FAD-dependent oxidoreductase n=1 Tax=Anaeromicrobium sp. TaxID=1929132 RepID=UPI0025F5CB1E|nr:hypothetical protein [Anaeromicrobium sp.]MCT4593122.1 hypothetical protein [Anaeromicrobium sp.]
MIRINEIRLTIDEDIKLLKKKISKKLRVNMDHIKEYHIYRQSIDARKRDNLYFVYTIDVEVENEDKILKKIKGINKSPNLEYIQVQEGEDELKNSPIIIGSGPAGMFCGLLLAHRGYNPIILERGEDVDERTKTIDNLWNNNKLNIESNVQFGEGGAGTFSDGKLTTRIKDKRCRKVLEEFVKAGAPEEIMYLHKPHIGTDILKDVVKNMRNSIIEHGGQVRFNAKVTDILIEDKKVVGVQVNNKEKIGSDIVILGVGHSARDTYKVLYDNGVKIEQKAFSVGVRIEHPQELINESQYKKFKDHPRLGAADYRLTHKTKDDRGVYTFCMCPGGVVVAAASEENMVVTNGMSEYKRDKENANSALLVQVMESDFGSDHPLGGVEFQRKWEAKAFKVGGGNYHAPAQLVEDFLLDRPSEGPGKVTPSYRPGVTWTNLNECLPDFVVNSLKNALMEMDKKLKGFGLKDAVMTAIETRSSAPVRILRDPKELESVNVKGLYPIGEGSGYAGGIVSAAVDGIKAAESIISKYKGTV